MKEKKSLKKIFAFGDKKRRPPEIHDLVGKKIVDIKYDWQHDVLNVKTKGGLWLSVSIGRAHEGSHTRIITWNVSGPPQKIKKKRRS